MIHTSKYELLSLALALMSFLFGVLVTTIYPLPFPDKGHRLFGVQDERAAQTLVAILAESGLKKKWAFDAGPTHQIVMSDNMTVIAWFNKEADNLPKNAISVAVDSPLRSSLSAINFLRRRGYKAFLHLPMNKDPSDDGTLYLVETNVMLGGGLVFRRPFWKMPAPKIRK